MVTKSITEALFFPLLFYIAVKLEYAVDVVFDATDALCARQPSFFSHRDFQILWFHNSRKMKMKDQQAMVFMLVYIFFPNRKRLNFSLPFAIPSLLITSARISAAAAAAADWSFSPLKVVAYPLTSVKLTVFPIQ